MNGLKLTTYQLADLLFRRDGGGVLLSLCREEEAEYVTESGDFLRFAPCDPETRGRVRAQAEEEQRRQGKVCRALGAAGGSFLVILLL